MNAILYITHTGAQWRYMPHDLPDWQMVYHYFAEEAQTKGCDAGKKVKGRKRHLLVDTWLPASPDSNSFYDLPEAP